MCYNTQSLSLANVKMPGTRRRDESDSSFGLISTAAAFAVFGPLAAAVVGGFNLYNHMQKENERENWRDKVLAEVRRTYGSLDEEMARELTRQYRQNTEEICQNVQATVNARIDDMENQLKNILLEKKSQEKNAEDRKKYFAQKQTELQKIGQILSNLKK